MPIAGIGSRFIAILVDTLVLAGAAVVLMILAALILPALHFIGNVSVNWAVGIVILIVFLLQWGYFAAFEAFNNGRTPGKHVAKIHVIYRSGRAITFIEALARNLVRFVDYMPGFYTIGIIAILVSKQSQRLGDMVAGTLVVRDHEIESPHWGELGSRTITAQVFTPAEPPLPQWRISLPMQNMARLSTAELEVLESFFARRLDMDLATRARLATRMAFALCAKSGLDFPDGTDVETFLEAVAHSIRELARLGSKPPAV